MTERTPAWNAIRSVVGGGHWGSCMDTREDHTCELEIDKETTALYRAVAEEVTE